MKRQKQTLIVWLNSRTYFQFGLIHNFYRFHAMAQKYIKPDQWTWLIVGDLSKIEEPIRKLNLGPVEVLD